jgi:hypothetical protein
LRLEPGAHLALLDDVQWVDLAEGELAFRRLWDGLRQHKLDPDDAFAWDPTRHPYPGLTPFALEDAAVFFGRNREVNELKKKLQPILRGPGQFVAIVGRPGAASPRCYAQACCPACAGAGCCCRRCDPAGSSPETWPTV